MKSTLSYYLIKFFLGFFALLPLPLNHRLGAFIGWLLYIFNSSFKKISEINIATCFPHLSIDQKETLIRKNMIELGKSITEIGPVWLWPTEKILDKIQIKGSELIQTAVNNKQGVILLNPHLGCWEITGLVLGKQWQTINFYQMPKIESLDKIIKQARERSGAKLVATNKKGLAMLIKGLKSAMVTGILPDQTPKDRNSGVFAPFFGREALTMTLVSSLAKRTNALVVTSFAKRLANGQGYLLEFALVDESILSDDPNVCASTLNHCVEELILQAPEQYLWSYKRFKQYPDGVEKLY